MDSGMSSTVFLSEKFQRALELAARRHGTQPRKGTDLPYIVHPVWVACLVYHYGGSDSAVLAALVHDLPEDTPVTVEEIRSLLGPRVAAIVASLTEPKHLPWVIRKRAALARYRSADEETRTVAGADKLTSLLGFARDPASRDDEYWERFNAGKPLQAWFYHSLCDVFTAAPFGGEFERLTVEVFGPRTPENPCALYLEYALRRRGNDALKRRLEARTLWLNVSEDDQAAMVSTLDRLLDDPDVETAAQAMIFLGFAGKAWTGADDRIGRILETDSRVPVVAAAMVASQVILDDAFENAPSLQRLVRARKTLAEDSRRRDAVLAHLEALAGEDPPADLAGAIQCLRQVARPS